jgi:hypothetical protein
MSKKKSKKSKNEKPKNLNWNPCHYGNQQIIKAPFKMFGGGWSRGMQITQDMVVIDCADVAGSGKIEFFNMTTPPELEDRYTTGAQIIRIAWPDGGIPAVGYKFWYGLVDYLERVQKPVLACCMGGHGRTGTALAIICAIMGLNGKQDIGKWVRKRLCKNAIETDEQVMYIEWITGQKTEINGSWELPMKGGKKSSGFYGHGSAQNYDQQKVFGYFQQGDEWIPVTEDNYGSNDPYAGYTATEIDALNELEDADDDDDAFLPVGMR